MNNDMTMTMTMTIITDLLNINVAMNMNVHTFYMLFNICFDAMHHVRRPIMEAK